MTTKVTVERPVGEREKRPHILWKRCRPEQVMLNLKLSGKQIRAKSPLLQLLIGELQTLLEDLFPEAQTILVEPMTQGYSQARVLKVQPFSAEGGGGLPVVVKFGDKAVIEQEYMRYQKYVLYFIADGHSTQIHNYRRMLHLAGIVYSFIGTSLSQLQDFGAFFQKASSEQGKLVLDNLFRRTCSMWYANQQTLKPFNLTEYYRQQIECTYKQLERTVSKRLSLETNQSTLRFKSLTSSQTRTFTNPFTAIASLEPVIRSTYVCTVHSDFNPRNILVDKVGNPWLLDFQGIGPGHILHDVAMLEIVLRLYLLTPELATLDERLALEEALCQITHYSELESWNSSYTTSNPVLAKTWDAVIHLRTIAHWITEKNPASDMDEYLITLFYLTLYVLQFNSLTDEQHEHTLLSASMLIDTPGIKGMHS